MQSPCVAPLLLTNKVAVTSASPEFFMVRGNDIFDTGWGQMVDTYPAHNAQWDVQVTWRSSFRRPELLVILYILQTPLRPPTLGIDTGWSQDVGAYPANHSQWDAQVAWRSTFHRSELLMML